MRTILQLAQKVQQAARAEDTGQGQTSGVLQQVHDMKPAEVLSSEQSSQSQWWSRSWAEVIERKARLASASPSPAVNASMQRLSAALQDKLRIPKRMVDSHAISSLPFKSKPGILEQYIATGGGVRLGKVLEDLDSLAGDASYRHVLGRRPSPADGPEENPIFIVTASVDRLDLIEPLRADRDYRLNGMVIYVGSSSMEVLVTVEEANGRAVLTGRFTMATRNAATGKAQNIPPLMVKSEAEKQLFNQGQSHKQRKQHEARVSLERVPPTSEESKLLHRLWLANQGSPQQEGGMTDHCIDIEETVLSSVSKMHPQQRNVHMKVFGGFLMRSAYELAFMNASMFARGKPVSFLSLDALSFHLPVSIGSVVSLTSRITYTSTSGSAGDLGDAVDAYSTKAVRGNEPGLADGYGAVAAVVVLAEIVDPSTGTRHKSNTFHFSFDLGDYAQRVLPGESNDGGTRLALSHNAHDGPLLTFSSLLPLLFSDRIVSQ